VSDIDAEYREADERVMALVGRIGSSGQDVAGQVGDEDPLQAVADALAPAGIQITSLPLHGEVLFKLVSGDGRYSDHRHSRPSEGADTWR